jgi:hypothetical protein
VKQPNSSWTALPCVVCCPLGTPVRLHCPTPPYIALHPATKLTYTNVF